jgi:soluble lytic murein transglycosylase-like protein
MRVEFGSPVGYHRVQARVAAIKARFRTCGVDRGHSSTSLPRPFSGQVTAGRNVAPAGAASSARSAIRGAAAHAGVDANLVLAVAESESGLRPDAISSKGAAGLMQLMPSTAAAFGVEDAFDLEQNARGGADYLRQLLDRFGGDVGLAVAAYNAGPGAVERYGGVPPYGETQRFVGRVLARLAELGGSSGR